MRRAHQILIVALLTLCRCLDAGISATPPLLLTKTIPLKHVTGRIDHMALDVAGQKLFVSALGNNTLEVLDLKTGRKIRTIRSCREPQGVVFIADRDQVIVANGGSGQVDVFKSPSFQLLKKFRELPDADDTRYNEKTGLVYVAYGEGALAVIQSATLEMVGEIKTDGHPEGFAVDPAGDHIFINVPDAHEVEVADRRERKVVAKWHVPSFGANFPMALDEKDHRLFVGCRHPARLVVFNTVTGEPVANLSLSEDNDDLYYDAARHRIYASCGAGFIDIFAQQNPDHYQRIARISTEAGARTSFYSPKLNEFFLAVPKSWKHQAAIQIFHVNQ